MIWYSISNTWIPTISQSDEISVYINSCILYFWDKFKLKISQSIETTHHRSAVYVYRHFKQLKCYDGLLESSFMFMMQVYLTHFEIVALKNLIYNFNWTHCHLSSLSYCHLQNTITRLWLKSSHSKKSKIADKDSHSTG